jgi:hypothetical protein
MKDYLERFEKRMELVAVADSIVGRANKNQEIEHMFAAGELDNILMSVLVFIMETTLTEEQDCTIEAITEFVSDILPAYGKRADAGECGKLTRYLIKDILQNKGETLVSPVMDYSGGMRGFSVRLIADRLGDGNQVLYELTKQGFDFLFRTKEVDDELGFEIEAIRLKMLISKKNYKKAMAQSRYILVMLSEKRNELRQFEQQLNNDIYSVSGEQYDEAVRNVYAMLAEERAVMRDIEKMLSLAQARLDEERGLYTALDEKSKAAQREVVYITENVRRALGMQNELLIKCEKLRKLYLSLLEDALLSHQTKRFNLEEQILRRMERLAFRDAAPLDKLSAGLLSPLFLPDIRKTLNLSLAYERQRKLKEYDNAGIVDAEAQTDDGGKMERIIARNNAHVCVIRLLTDYAKTRAAFRFGDFWEHIQTHGRMAEITAERLLFLDMLKLYEIHEIDLEKWRREAPPSLDCMGEFDLDYCLARCADTDDTLFSIKRLLIEKAEGRITCKTNGNERIYMDDLLFEVVLNEADGENLE